MTTTQYRVYNHSTFTLIVSVAGAAEGAPDQHFLLPAGCASPPMTATLAVWAESEAAIDGAPGWALQPMFDAHITETQTPSGPQLHIAGLGATPIEAHAPKLPKYDGVWATRENEIWVTVLGAGITGLTAAHELCTRGFRVQVIERAHGSPADSVGDATSIERFGRGLTSPDVGGIARTQWSTPPLELGILSVSKRDVNEPLAAMRSVHGDCFWFGADQTGPLKADDDYRAYGVPWTRTGLDLTIARGLLSWLRGLSVDEARSVAAVQLVVVVYGVPTGAGPAEGYARLAAFVAWLRSADPEIAELRQALDRLEVMPTARIDVSEAPSTEPFVGLLVRAHEDLGLVAGEHGFRFFPGFYRHLRDTMRRTPIYDPQTQSFTQRSVNENLAEVDWQFIADPSRKNTAALSRVSLTSIGALSDQYRVIRRDLGYRPIDLLRLFMRLLRYMTSSTPRREQYYEKMSWWDFVTLKRFDDPTRQRFTFGTRFEAALHHAPKALIAMDAEYADARTYGNVATQLFMDQFDLHEESDSTLEGPTSTTWLSHWRKYLEEQGVRFFLGEVIKISGAINRRASVQIVFPGDPPKDYIDGEAAVANQSIFAHYFLSALDLPNLARVTRSFRTPGDREDYGVLTDLRQLIGSPERDLEDISEIGRTGAGNGLADRFQTLTGIQLYYRSPFSFEHGHIYFAGSPWGLSAISQIQYWGPFGSGKYTRLLGNLSVDIGAWRPDADYPDPNLLQRQDIADAVQQQIRDSLKRPTGDARLGPTYYHLDDFIGFALVPDPTAEGARRVMLPRRNRAPFLINLAGEWRLRPRGQPWDPSAPAAQSRTSGDGVEERPLWWPVSQGYPVHFGNLVIAGTHLRTYTRLATMEAANESARHAVNTILDHAAYRLDHSGFLARQLEVQAAAAPREPQRPLLNNGKAFTPFGDYCDIWNPELNEFPDLEFLRTIDSHLLDATASRASDDAPQGRSHVAPHLFDILRLDELPDWIDDDPTALGVFDLVGSVLQAFDGASSGDIASIFTVIDKARTKLADLFQRRPA